MGEQFSDLRHPRIPDCIAFWKLTHAKLSEENPLDPEAFFERPDAQTVRNYNGVFEVELIDPLRVAAAATGLRAFAKAIEMSDARRLAELNGATASALLLSYDAAYLCARAGCTFLGVWSPERDTTLSVDLLFNRQLDGDGDELESTVGFFESGKWGHDLVWKLLGRLTRTARKYGPLEANFAYLRKDKLKNVSRQRNAQIYDDKVLFAGDNLALEDFPDLLIHSSASVLDISKRYRNIYTNLFEIIMHILVKSQLSEHLPLLCSGPRLSRAA